MEKEAEEGKSLDEPTLKEDLAAQFDKLEIDDGLSENDGVVRESHAGGEHESGAEEIAEESPADGNDEILDSDGTEETGDNEAGAETVTIEEHLPEDFKAAVKDLDEEVLKPILETVKVSENRANAKFEEAAEARKFYDTSRS